MRALGAVSGVLGKNVVLQNIVLLVGSLVVGKLAHKLLRAVKVPKRQHFGSISKRVLNRAGQ